MKTRQTIIFAILLLLIVACDRSDYSAKTSICDDPTLVDLKTRSDGFEADIFFVTEEDLSAYVKYKSLLLKKELTVRSIEPITLNSENPLLWNLHDFYEQ